MPRSSDNFRVDAPILSNGENFVMLKVIILFVDDHKQIVGEFKVVFLDNASIDQVHNMANYWSTSVVGRKNHV